MLAMNLRQLLGSAHRHGSTAGGSLSLSGLSPDRTDDRTAVLRERLPRARGPRRCGAHTPGRPATRRLRLAGGVDRSGVPPSRQNTGGLGDRCAVTSIGFDSSEPPISRYCDIPTCLPVVIADRHRTSDVERTERKARGRGTGISKRKTRHKGRVSLGNQRIRKALVCGGTSPGCSSPTPSRIPATPEYARLEAQSAHAATRSPMP